MWLSPPGVIDALNYWGSVPGWKLMSWGVAEDLEETREYEVNVLLCGRYVLYARLNPDPLAMRPYFKACYDEIPWIVLGPQHPGLGQHAAADVQRHRVRAGQQHEHGLGPHGLGACRSLGGRRADHGNLPVEAVATQERSHPGREPRYRLLPAERQHEQPDAALRKWEMRADDATGVPRYTYGNGVAAGAGDTAQGLSAHADEQRGQGLRRAIGNVDMNVIAPTINVTFNNEMLYNKDESIRATTSSSRAAPRRS